MLLSFYICFRTSPPMRSAPMTKIRLIVLVCAICLFIGLALLVGITEERKDIKAKMTEVTNSMSNVASAVAAYNQDENSWPHCDLALWLAVLALVFFIRRKKMQKQFQ
jgi:uncharacterized protein YneF (UPF0154 family)